jgi:signal transduction histidine kinase
VKDTGLGISEEDKPTLFKMFGKLQSTAQINTSGIGLGLFICKRLCETFEGSISLGHSKLGEGTTFHFSIKT